jgi:hypothetical protein
MLNPPCSSRPGSSGKSSAPRLWRPDRREQPELVAAGQEMRASVPAQITGMDQRATSTAREEESNQPCRRSPAQRPVGIAIA